MQIRASGPLQNGKFSKPREMQGTFHGSSLLQFKRTWILCCSFRLLDLAGTEGRRIFGLGC
jgi:hypothetical protein